MAERQILKREPGMGLKAGEQGPQKRPNDLEHIEANFGRRHSKSTFSKDYGVFAAHGGSARLR